MDDLMDEFEYNARLKKERTLDITEDEIEDMQDYIEECNAILDKLNELEKVITREDLKDFPAWLKECFYDEVGNTIDRYKEQIEEWEDYDPNDYISNEGL